MIYGNAVAIDGGEILLVNNIDGGERGIYMPGGGGDPYTGDLIVTPKAYDQTTLACAHKTMPGDVVVLEVPYYETHNDNGLTAYIASEV